MKNNWIKIGEGNLPHTLQIVEFKHKDRCIGIVSGNLVPYYDSRGSFTSWFVYPSDSSADMWIGDFTHYRKIFKN